MNENVENEEFEKNKHSLNSQNTETHLTHQLSLNLNSTLLKKEITEPTFKNTINKKKFEVKMTEDEKEMNRKILKNMNRKLNFVRNPRFRNNNKCLLYSNNLFRDILNPENPFVVDPMVVTFREYQMNNVYQIDLKLLNRKHLLTSFKYIPPVTENFSVKRIIYPKKDTSLIAPGMSAKVEILFNASSLDSFEDELTIITENFAFKVKLLAIRDTAALTLENPMDCKKCLIGDQVSMVFRCKNNGGDAHFKFLEKEYISTDDQLQSGSQLQMNSQLNYDNEVMEMGPFSIFPSEFYLYRGMMIEIFVNFSPKSEGLIEKDLIICCDSKQNLDYKLLGEGILIDLQLISLDGLKIDETLEKLENLFFDDTFPFTSNQRQMRVLNKSSVPVKFHWSFYDFYAQNSFLIDDDNKFFQIEPEEGIFQPEEEILFTIKFNPQNSKIYEQKLDLMIEDVPFQAIKQYSHSINLQTIRHKNNFTKGEPFMLTANSPYPSYPIFSFYLKGKGKLPFLELDNTYIDLGHVFIGQNIMKTFSVNNPLTGKITFKLSRLWQMIEKNNQNLMKVNNFFKDENRLINESIFKNKNSMINFDNNNYNNKNKIMNNTGNFIDRIFSNLNPSKNHNNFEHDNYDKVDFIRIFSNQKFLVKSKIPITNLKLKNQKSKISNSFKKGMIKAFNSIKSSRSHTINSTKSEHSMDDSNSNINSPKEFDLEIVEDTLLIIEKDQRVDFNVTFIPKKLGKFKATLLFTPEDGIPFSIDFHAIVKGPKIRVNSPCLDFGLFKISEIKKLSFKITNTSPIGLNYLIKQSKFKNLNFKNYLEEEYVNLVEGEINEKVFRKNIKSIYDYENRNLIKRDNRELDLFEFKISSVYGRIEPNKEKEITVK